MKRLKVAILAAAVALAPAFLAPAVAEVSAAGAGYTEREVQIPTADGRAMLGGTLTVPDSDGAYPASVLLSVAGPNDRDQRVGELAGFRELARHLAAQGIASLRFDDRGVGASTGTYFTTSWETFADDAARAHDLLAAQPEIDPARIGFLGMSQGGAIGAMASRLRPASAFVVLLSAPGLTGREALRGQLDTTIRLGGVPPELAARYRALFDEYMSIVAAPATDDLAERRQRMLAFLSGPGRQLLPPYRFVPQDNEGIADMLLGPWYAGNVGFDPAPVYGALTVPVLAIGGGRDVIAPPAQHLVAIRALLESAPTGDATTLWFESGNHLLQVSRTGLPAEYPTLGHGMSPEIMAIIASWIAYRFGSPAGGSTEP